MWAVILKFLAPYLFRLAIGGAIAAAGGIGFVAVKVHYTNIGYQRAMDEIAADNKEAKDAADQARDRVRNCRDTGGVWNTENGVCDRRS